LRCWLREPPRPNPLLVRHPYHASLKFDCLSSQFAKKTVAPEKGPQSTLYGLTVHGHLSGSAAAQLPQQRQRFLVHVGVIVLACVVGRLPQLDRRLDIRTQEHERYGLVLVL